MLQSDGTFVFRTNEGTLQDLIAALRAQFGDDFDVSPAGLGRLLLEAGLVVPATLFDSDIEDALSQVYFDSAIGANFDRVIEMAGDKRKVAARAHGVVNLDFLAYPTTPTPYFTNGNLVFLDANQKRFEMTADVVLPGAAFDQTQGGTASETIDGTNTRIAQKFVLASRQYVQAFASKPTGTITINARVETNVGGSPSGTLAHANLTRSALVLATGVRRADVWKKGAYLDAGTYWFIVERVSGSATFDGVTTGTAAQVKFYNGAWNVSGNIANLNCSVYLGGSVAVQARDLGIAGNLAAFGVKSVLFLDGGANTRWNGNVATFGNFDALAGGQDDESVLDARTRIRATRAALPGCSLDGIVTAVAAVATSADGIENTDDTPTSIDNVFVSTQTGTASQTIDGTRTRIAQKIVTTKRRFIHTFKGKLAAYTGLVLSVALQTDAAGAPSGTPVHADLQTTGFDPAGTTAFTQAFTKGHFVDPGTYWLVHTRTAGSGTFDGGTAAPAAQAQNYNGAWATDANISNMNTSLVGGVPPHSFRIYADGGLVNDIAKAIETSRAAGIPPDGATSGLYVDKNRTSWFERPTVIPVFVNITVVYTPDFTGTATTVKDAIIAYIGGTDSKGVIQPGLKVSKKLIRQGLIDAVKDLTGVHDGDGDVTVCQLDRTASPTATANMTAATGEVFRISDPANIVVTLTAA